MDLLNFGWLCLAVCQHLGVILDLHKLSFHLLVVYNELMGPCCPLWCK
jgi:hypothetical protein